MHGERFIQAGKLPADYIPNPEISSDYHLSIYTLDRCYKGIDQL